MNQPTVISVNPGEKTLGAINEEARRYETINARLAAQVAADVMATPAFKDTINFITGINADNVTGISGKLASLRLICSAALGYAAYLGMNVATISSTAMIINIALCILSVSLLFGFGTRIISVVSLGIMGIFAFSGAIDMTDAIMYSAPALLFVVMGPGIYSCDQLIRRAVLKVAKRKDTVRTSFSYKAYSQL